MELKKRKKNLALELKNGLVDAVDAAEEQDLASFFRFQMVSSRLLTVPHFEAPSPTEFKVNTAKRSDFCFELLDHLKEDSKAGFKLFLSFDGDQIDGGWITEYFKAVRKKKCPVTGALLGPSDHVMDMVQYWEKKLSPEREFLYLIRLLKEFQPGKRGLERLIAKPVTFCELFVEKKAASMVLLQALKKWVYLREDILTCFLLTATATALTVVKGKAIHAILDKKPQDSDSGSLLIKCVTSAVHRISSLEPDILAKMDEIVKTDEAEIVKTDEADEVVKESALAADMASAFELLVRTREELSDLLSYSLSYCGNIEDKEHRNEMKFSFDIILTAAGVERKKRTLDDFLKQKYNQ